MVSYSVVMELNISGPDIVGFIGVSFVVGTYFLSQMGRMDVNRPLYPVLNGVGALMILFSLYFTFNAASFVIELFWLMISIAGLARILLNRRKD